MQGAYKKDQGPVVGRHDGDPNHFEGRRRYVNKEGKVKVGLLLPLTNNPYAKIAQDMKQSAEMAVFEKGTKDFVLVTRDTKGTPEGAKQAAQEVIDEGVGLIIGPFYSTSVTAVKPIAKRRGICVLSFSNNSTVAGDGAFVFGFSPEQEIYRVVGYATAKSKTDFAVIAPNTTYGETSIRAMQKSVQRFGGQLVHVARYDPKKDPQMVVKSISFDEVDAVLVPDGGQDLIWVLSYVSHFQNDEDEKIQLLGTRLWENPLIARDPVLRGGWYASIDLDRWKQFEGRFFTNFSRKPHRFASMSYDLVAFASYIAKSPQGIDYSKQRLTDLTGYVGINGNFRLNDDGTVERALSVFEVTPSGPEKVSPAMDSFL